MRRGISLACVALLVGCGTEPVETSTEVRIVVDVAPSLGGQILRVKVFNTERLDVLDEVQALTGVELPIVIPLFPDGPGERSYHVVLELLGAGGAALGTQRVVGAYVEDERRFVRVRFSSACADVVCPGNETCREESGVGICVGACVDPQPESVESSPPALVCPTHVYVDGVGTNAPEACLGPDSPCADVSYALDNYVSAGEGATVFVAGGTTYGRFFIGPDTSGGVEKPTVVQAWPGRPRPIFDGSAEARPVMGTCCGNGAGHDFVLDGLEVMGGTGCGIQVHGDAARNIIVRNCLVYGTGLGDLQNPNQEAGIVVSNDASNVVVSNCEVRDNLEVDIDENGLRVGTSGIAATGNSISLMDNLVRNNSGYGLYIIGTNHVVLRNQSIDSGADGIRLSRSDSARIEDNRVCSAAGDGVANSDGPGLGSQRVRMEHNTILRFGGDGIALSNFSNDWVVRANIFAFGSGFGLSRNELEESEPEDSANLYWMNASGAYGSTTPDGTDWLDSVDPAFEEECSGVLGAQSEARMLVEGGPVGVRPAD